jgi:signal transduction histidine kinase
MGIRFGLRSQIVLVAALFVASLAVLLSSSLATVWLPGQEDEARQLLSAASRKMAEKAAALREETPGKRGKKPPGEWHHRLEEITRKALANLEGVEGGFFLAGSWNQFTGYAFPNDPVASPELPPSEKVPPPVPKGKLKAKDKEKGKDNEGPPPRRDPPPKEKDFILAQCKACLTNEPDTPPIVQTTQIGLSRVLVVTEPVGPERPALLATWVMTRLTRPEQLLRRNQVSAALALAGVLVALVLAANLGRNLRQERRQREQLREELRRSEHLASLGKLLAGVAHEVRNPLAAIRSTAQLYQRLPEQARDPSALDAIVQGVDRLNALVSRLLFFVRSGYEQRRSVDLNAVVQETLTLLHAQAGTQGVVLQTELAADLPPILGSSQALQQVVQNLTMNAMQAMPGGGVLHCRTRRLGGPPRVELEIADTGPGIAPADRAHLFEPFWTTRPEGTGLGLALCREIVQQHGGQIDLVSQPGWGAVFHVSLPVDEEEKHSP